MTDASADRPTISLLGDAALLVTFGVAVEPALNARAHALVRAVELQRSRGSSPWGRSVPAYASVLVPFDSLGWEAEAAIGMLDDLVDAAAVAGEAVDAADAPDALVIDVRYGADDGPDLDDVARAAGLTPDEVVAEHTSGRYRVYFLGFAPGFGYLGPLSPKLQLPRRATPRTRVPAGSVAIAGAQTAVYPLATPGGWHLIGRTEAPLWDAQRDPPALLCSGQEIRFRAVEG